MTDFDFGPDRGIPTGKFSPTEAMVTVGEFENALNRGTNRRLLTLVLAAVADLAVVVLMSAVTSSIVIKYKTR